MKTVFILNLEYSLFTVLKIIILELQERTRVTLRFGTSLREHTWQLTVRPNVLLICENTSCKPMASFVNKAGEEASFKWILLHQPRIQNQVKFQK